VIEVGVREQDRDGLSVLEHFLQHTGIVPRINQHALLCVWTDECVRIHAVWPDWVCSQFKYHRQRSNSAGEYIQLIELRQAIVRIENLDLSHARHDLAHHLAP